jgi:sulfite dehydrogenase
MLEPVEPSSLASKLRPRVAWRKGPDAYNAWPETLELRNFHHGAQMTRREWLQCWLALGAAGWTPGCQRAAPRSLADEMELSEQLARFPGKVPLRVVNDRPPCLETPWRFFEHDFTPNEAFYVRWHLQALPTSIDVATWRLKIGGHVEKPLELSLPELKALPAASIVAVNQCSGNSRALADPQVPGAQWRNGAMGNARWTGVRLADVLERAGLRAGAVDVTFNGLDEGPLSSVPDFVKSLTVDHARQPEVLVAYEMNGEPLPLLNGFPLRLIVPGWYATYWVKMLSEINVLSEKYDGYWMAKAYKIPANMHAEEKPDELAEHQVPISRMGVRSFFVRPKPEATLARAHACDLEGIAFDGGSGIRRVQVSVDGGKRWREAKLDADLGPFSFRRWRLTWTPEEPGAHRLLVRAVSRDGEEQPTAARWNRGGFMRNVVEELELTVV